MALTTSMTGRFGNLTFNGVTLPITQWTGKFHREYAVATDSNNLNTTVNQLQRSRKPGEEWIEGSFEGNYDFGGSTDANLAQLFFTDGPYSLVLGFTRTINFASFNADVDDMALTVKVDGAAMITYSANYVSNGLLTVY